jgi:uncharacterized protein (TIGR03118 family)
MKSPFSLSSKQGHCAALIALLSLTTALICVPAQAQYRQRNIVSDIPGMAELTDPNLINPWGASRNATSPFWVSNAGSRTSTLYAVNGTTGVATITPLVVNTGPISGQIANTTTDFTLATGGTARFIFAGLNGSLYGWNNAQGTNAAAVHTGAPAYTGLTNGQVGNANFLYAANPVQGRVDVFDSSFSPVTLAGDFADPGLPAGYSPFNVKNLGGSLFVTYLHQGSPGGIVNQFNTDGTFVRRFATDGTLLDPWGLAVAPADFGPLSNALLVGNFNEGNVANGHGYINAFDPTTGAFLGFVQDPNGTPVEIDGLWEIVFGNGANGGVRNQLYFTAGIQDEQHGLFGSLQAVPEPGVWALLSAAGMVTLSLQRRRKR